MIPSHKKLLSLKKLSLAIAIFILFYIYFSLLFCALYIYVSYICKCILCFVINNSVFV